ncbi:energy-coupling factor ABC transporter ATP-binding protein [Clostridium luticellarii]|jgi:cobalt/nickel transport system ATP-binding protein|uniref:Cobalt import ATP-binding protein CbiO n=1 Tax=Clostridium luticellarii TaxID=1691940 RepID=A0A2T0BMH9_9CLOT|nr:ABC transporter ATP-binding protein [Clostridium luticellarii]MCI1945260.1 energy-coupling factor ABC transporter ATP-binding protein [Clostridium luticellarii]MCI1969000.1 energy-coupling factor ABC transporter ATP-binding protein [Clostridium luticellarii]MCI1994593.1 energy-coupling factor ABC transporter ATP-binding protein [Clostridium luticellarii]MCI2038910.1 energy-coupling factor ABC transporter ATP-binding protein [Clostridium luticellarii]PRR85088.1 Cobalt import ATP-binding prot
MIEFKEVFFKYKDEEVLKNINVKIEPGDSVALIGANGSGKSTFLKLLNGIIFPTSGSYYFDNVKISQHKLEQSSFSKKFHKKMGFVFQNSDAQLFCSSVYEEVAFGPRQMGMDEAEVKKRVEDCLNLLNVKDLQNKEPYNISGGEKKRVAIAAVLALNPEVLILDEPMSGIDPKGKKFLNNLFIDLNKAGKTIICSTHDFEYVKGLFKRVLVFSEDHLLIKDDSYERIIEDNNFLTKYNIK